MRIALVSPGYPPAVGGVEQVVAQQARALAKTGHKVEVYAQERTAERIGVREDAGVVIHGFAVVGLRDYSVSPGLWQSIAAESGTFDVVHSHSYHALTGLTAALRAQAPTVFSPHYHGTGHSPLRVGLHRLYRPVGLVSFARAAAVVCVSDAEAKLVAAHFPAAQKKITVVPNAVAAEAIQAARPFPGEPPTVLCVSRLEGYKRIDRVIESFAALQITTMKGTKRPQLVVIGDGPDRPRLEEIATETGRSHSAVEPGTSPLVRFLGRIPEPDLYRWLRTCHLLCSFSEHEAFGLAPAEAVAAGAAVLLSDIPAHSELAKRCNAAAPGSIRLAAQSESDGNLAVRMADLLRAPRRASSAAHGLPDWDEVAEQLTEIYQRIPVQNGGAER